MSLEDLSVCSEDLFDSELDELTESQQFEQDLSSSQLSSNESEPTNDLDDLSVPTNTQLSIVNVDPEGEFPNNIMTGDETNALEDYMWIMEQTQANSMANLSANFVRDAIRRLEDVDQGLAENLEEILVKNFGCD